MTDTVELSEVDKAAIMLMSLHKEEASAILKHLSPMVLKHIYRSKKRTYSKLTLARSGPFP